MTDRPVVKTVIDRSTTPVEKSHSCWPRIILSDLSNCGLTTSIWQSARKNVHLKVNKCAKSILLIVQYRYLKSSSEIFILPESDPPHKIMRYWFYYSILLNLRFQFVRVCHFQIICIGGVLISKGISAGPALNISLLKAGNRQVRGVW